MQIETLVTESNFTFMLHLKGRTGLNKFVGGRNVAFIAPKLGNDMRVPLHLT